MTDLAIRTPAGIILEARTPGKVLRFPREKHEDSSMTGQQRPSHHSGVPQLMKTISAITHTLLAAAVIWVGTNINNANVTMARFSSDFAAIQKQQDSVVAQLKQLHDSVLIMSSTYATKDDVSDNVEHIRRDIESMKGSILVLENKVQSLSHKDDQPVKSKKQ